MVRSSGASQVDRSPAGSHRAGRSNPRRCREARGRRAARACALGPRLPPLRAWSLGLPTAPRRSRSAARPPATSACRAPGECVRPRDPALLAGDLHQLLRSKGRLTAGGFRRRDRSRRCRAFSSWGNVTCPSGLAPTLEFAEPRPGRVQQARVQRSEQIVRRQCQHHHLSRRGLRSDGDGPTACHHHRDVQRQHGRDLRRRHRGRQRQAHLDVDAPLLRCSSTCSRFSPTRWVTSWEWRTPTAVLGRPDCATMDATYRTGSDDFRSLEADDIAGICEHLSAESQRHRQRLRASARILWRVRGCPRKGCCTTAPGGASTGGGEAVLRHAHGRGVCWLPGAAEPSMPRGAGDCSHRSRARTCGSFSGRGTRPRARCRRQRTVCLPSAALHLAASVVGRRRDSHRHRRHAPGGQQDSERPVGPDGPDRRCCTTSPST